MPVSEKTTSCVAVEVPAANDPEAMRYVGAVGFHSWGGASAQEYGAWAELAERLGLPLLVAELGVDAGAWRGRMFDSYHYGMREVQMYQEILLHARPQGTMQWEFTSDYGMVRARTKPDGGVALEPTPRFWLVKHFCNLTPQHADALATASDHPKVLLTAFAAGRTLTLHLANLGPGRDAAVSGIPGSVASLRAVRTSQDESFQELDRVPVRRGSVTVELPPRCLVTLTTMPEE